MRSGSKAFTLIEVLVVLTLVGMTFSVLLLILSRGTDSSLNVTRGSENLKMEVRLFWDIQRKVLGAKRIRVEGNNLYLITSAGDFYPGVVKCAYIYRDGELYYYEFPYPYGAINEVEEDKLYRLGKVEKFEVVAIERNREERAYEGLPRLVKVRLNGREFVFETIR